MWKIETLSSNKHEKWKPKWLVKLPFLCWWNLRFLWGKSWNTHEHPRTPLGKFMIGRVESPIFWLWRITFSHSNRSNSHESHSNRSIVAPWKPGLRHVCGPVKQQFFLGDIFFLTKKKLQNHFHRYLKKPTKNHLIFGTNSTISPLSPWSLHSIPKSSGF